MTRGREDDILKRRTFTADLDVTTGGATKVPLGTASHTMRLVSMTLLPAAAFAASASHHWTLKLQLYDASGHYVSAVPRSKVALSTLSLAVGRAIKIPRGHSIAWALKAGYSLYVDVAETGTAAALRVRVQVDATLGGR